MLLRSLSYGTSEELRDKILFALAALCNLVDQQQYIPGLCCPLLPI